MKSSRGSISIYMVIIMPVLLVGMLLIGQKVFEIQKKQQLLTQVDAINDVQMSLYSESLFEDYRLMAYSDEVITTLIEEMKAREQFGDDVTFEVTPYTLNNPEYLNRAILEAGRLEGILEIAGQIEAYCKSLKVDDEKSEALNKAVDAEKAVAKTIDNDGLAKKMKKLTKDVSTTQLNNTIDKMKSIKSNFISKINEKKGDISEAAYASFQDYISKLSAFTISLEVYEVTLEEYETQIESTEDSIDRLKDRKRDLKDEGGDTTSISNSIFRKKETLDYLKEKSARLKAQISSETDQFNEEYLSGDMAIFDTLSDLWDSIKAFKVQDYFLEQTPWHYDSDTVKEITKDKWTDITISGIDKVVINEFCLGILTSHDPKTKRNFDMTGRKYERTHVLDYEVEFLLGNNEIDVVNDFTTKMKIFAIREAANIITILSSQQAKSQIALITAPIPPVFNIPAKSLLIGGLAAGESILDIEAMLDGKSIKILKSFSDFKLSPQGLVDRDPEAIKNFGKEIVDLNGSNKVESKTSNTMKSNSFDDLDELYYQDYLRLLLYLQGIDKTELRLMKLLEHNLNMSDQTLDSMHIGHKIRITESEKLIFELERFYE